MRANPGLGFVAALLACLPIPALAQTPAAELRAKEIEQVCRTAHCREARTVRLRREDGSTFEAEVPRLPIVLPNGWITVYPGEEIHVELDVAGEQIKGARAVAKPAHPQATLTFKLAQAPGSAETMLSVTHGFARTIKYSVGMMLPSGGQLYATSTCPVQAGLTAYEHWQHPVFQLVVTSVRFLPPGAALTCER